MHRATGTGVRGGCLGMILLGVAGACVGGYVSRLLGGSAPSGLDLRSMVVSVVGAVVFLVLARALFGHKR